MASFDIVSEIDLQKLDNAINVAVKEISTRFDFNGSKTILELDKKTSLINILTENDMRMKAIQDILIGRMVKQGLDSSSLDFGKEQQASGNMLKKEIKIKMGIDKETAKKIVKLIKDEGFKVQASIMDEQVRVTGKKLDDLQSVMAAVKKQDWDFLFNLQITETDICYHPQVYQLKLADIISNSTVKFFNDGINFTSVSCNNNCNRQ